MTGFCCKEIMEGYHYFHFNQFTKVPKKYPFKFEVEWGTQDLKQTLKLHSSDFMVFDLAGHVYVDGWLKEKAAVMGYLKLDYLHGNIKYKFDFYDKGRRYIYVGEKVNIRPWNLLTSHTTCFGTIVTGDTNEPVLISKSVTFFKLKNATKFLTSFRLTRQ